MYNEQPTLLAILIVTYVITKQFFDSFYSNHSLYYFAFISYMIMKPKKVKKIDEF